MLLKDVELKGRGTVDKFEHIRALLKPAAKPSTAIVVRIGLSGIPNGSAGAFGLLLRNDIPGPVQLLLDTAIEPEGHEIVVAPESIAPNLILTA